jgi:hypothetical protein
MNNIALGGYDPVRGRSFAYYETIGGGMGASRERPGLSGIHTHMTNSLNTPLEPSKTISPSASAASSPPGLGGAAAAAAATASSGNMNSTFPLGDDHVRATGFRSIRPRRRRPRTEGRNILFRGPAEGSRLESDLTAHPGTFFGSRRPAAAVLVSRSDHFEKKGRG